MTTLERAKKFYKRVQRWAGGSNAGTYEYLGDMANMLYCQARVARALIRQQERRAAISSTQNLDSEYDMGLYDGLTTALQILDTVYGRNYDNT